MIKEVQISADKLAENIEDYPENLEIFIGGQWLVIGTIGVSTVIDGVYTSV